MPRCSVCGETSSGGDAYVCNYCERIHCGTHRVPEQHDCPFQHAATPPDHSESISPGWTGARTALQGLADRLGDPSGDDEQVAEDEPTTDEAPETDDTPQEPAGDETTNDRTLETSTESTTDDGAGSQGDEATAHEPTTDDEGERTCDRCNSPRADSPCAGCGGVYCPSHRRPREHDCSCYQPSTTPGTYGRTRQSTTSSLTTRIVTEVHRATPIAYSIFVVLSKVALVGLAMYGAYVIVL